MTSPTRPRLFAPLRRREVFGAGVALAGAAALSACGPKAAESGKQTSAAAGGGARIVRDFSDTLLELGRLLKEAAEIEHDLMVQYLYGAFSLKPIYGDLIGSGAPQATDLLGVAVQEMQHLRAVNKLLVELGFAPVLTRHDFPYESDIYPFPFRLEPLSRASLAKYTYCEAPPSALQPRTPAESAFVADLLGALGTGPRPNHVGSLYDAIISGVEELSRAPNSPLKRPNVWVEELQRIKEEGEHDHYLFFRSLFTGEHPLFSRRGGVWAYSPSDRLYPSIQVPTDPTAYQGHPRAIADETARRLAWLGNLTYWACLSLLDLCYRGVRPAAAQHAVALMTAAILPLARRLAEIGHGLPFDPLSMGYGAGATPALSVKLTDRMIGEARACARTCGESLPGDWPDEIFEAASAALKAP